MRTTHSSLDTNKGWKQQQQPRYYHEYARATHPWLKFKLIYIHKHTKNSNSMEMIESSDRAAAKKNTIF